MYGSGESCLRFPALPLKGLAPVFGVTGYCVPYVERRFEDSAGGTTVRRVYGYAHLQLFLFLIK